MAYGASCQWSFKALFAEEVIGALAFRVVKKPFGVPTIYDRSHVHDDHVIGEFLGERQLVPHAESST